MFTTAEARSREPWNVRWRQSSLESGLPAVFVRKAAKEYGTCQAVEGMQTDGRKVVLVEDVIISGPR